VSLYKGIPGVAPSERLVFLSSIPYTEEQRLSSIWLRPKAAPRSHCHDSLSLPTAGAGPCPRVRSLDSYRAREPSRIVATEMNAVRRSPSTGQFPLFVSFDGSPT
jgi:hypothetical protein